MFAAQTTADGLDLLLAGCTEIFRWTHRKGLVGVLMIQKISPTKELKEVLFTFIC